MVIASVGRESTMQRTLSEDDDVIQTLAANGPNEPFHVGPLPGRTRCRKHLFDAHCLHLIDEVLPEDSIPIAQQILWRAVPRKGLPQLLDRPLSGRMCGHCKVHDSSALMRQHQKHIQDLKPDRWDR